MDPNFNVWASLEPFAQTLIEEEAGKALQTGWGEIELIAKAIFSLPRRADSILRKIERGEVVVQNPALSDQVGRLERALRRLTLAVLFAALLVAGVQLLLGGESRYGNTFIIVAAIIFLRLLCPR
jgi:predicted unusual protein kinase regulating ubiquinone biosynthesis (AarF/ABC1/UbiB family)